MSRRTRPKISVREKAVALAGALTLAYSAWGFGGVLDWSLHIMLAGGLLTFALVLAPLPWVQFSPMAVRCSPLQKNACKRLLGTPAFYLAGLFLAYLAIAALNPAWEIASDSRGWWLESVAPPLASWLPTSVEAPYEP
ncbi:MAG: hypothetical protein R6U56_00440, partial [Opitutales bacterium]